MSQVQVLILSDTHGSPDPRIAELSGEMDYVVHGGDLGGLVGMQGLRPRERIIAVRGNNDTMGAWDADDPAALESLQEVAELELPGGLLVVEHGHRVNPAAQRHQRLRLRHPEARLVVYGHSHKATIDQTASPWVANPGAAGRVRTFGGPSCIQLTASEKAWELELIRFALEPASKRQKSAI